MVSYAPSYRVVEAVARKEGVPPSELSPPLFSVVDPDALDTLVRGDADSNADRVNVEFTYLDYVVRIRNDSTVNVSARDGESPTGSTESVPGP